MATYKKLIYKKSPLEVINESKPLVSSQRLATFNLSPCKGLYSGVDTHGTGSVIVPLKDINGDIKAIEYLPDRGPAYLSGRCCGVFFEIGQLKTAKKVWVANNLRSALIIWEALGKKETVINTGSLVNLVPAVCSIANKYPALILVIYLNGNNTIIDYAKRLQDQYPEICKRIKYIRHENLNKYASEKTVTMEDGNQLCLK